MKRSKYYLLFIIFGFMFFSCSQNKEKNLNVKWRETKEIVLKYQTAPCKKMVTMGDKYYIAASMQKLLLLNKEGDVIDSIGGKGKAPGEFQTIDQIIAGKWPFFYVNDAALERLNMFSIKKGRFKFIKSKRMNVVRVFFINNYLYCRSSLTSFKLKLIKQYDANLNLIGEFIEKKVKNVNEGIKLVVGDIVAKNNIVFLSYLMTGKIEKYKFDNNKLSFVNSIIIKNELKEIRNKKRSNKQFETKLSRSFVTEKYFVQAFSKEEKDTQYKFNIYDLELNFLGNMSILTNGLEGSFFDLSNDFKAIKFLDKNNVIHCYTRIK